MRLAVDPDDDIVHAVRLAVLPAARARGDALRGAEREVLRLAADRGRPSCAEARAAVYTEK